MERKLKKSVTIIIATVVFAAIFFLKCGRTEPQNQSASKFIQNKTRESFISPPIHGEDIAYTSYQIKSGKKTVLTHTTGSRIHIPADAFVDENGKPIKGKVTIKYREMHNAWDFFVSGIPMTYAKDSVKYHFESAGMFDIQGIVDGKQVYIAPGKTLKIDLASQNRANRFNNYYLDTISKRWLELGKNIVLISQRKEIECDTTKSSLLKVPVAPLEPFNADSVVKILELRVIDRKDFPELDGFENLKFEVIEDHGQYKSEKEPINCALPKITPSESKPGYYNLSMMMLKKNKSFWINWLVRPAFEGNDYAKAMSIYQDQLRKYKESLKRQEEQRIEMERAKKRENTMAQVYRALEVTKFGIYNCDNPLLIEWPSISPVFITKNGEKIMMQQITVFDKSINGIIRYELSNNNKIQINPKSDQMIIGVANDTVLYGLKADKMQQLNFTTSTCKISMERFNDHSLLEKMARDFFVSNTKQ